MNLKKIFKKKRNIFLTLGALLLVILLVTLVLVNKYSADTTADEEIPLFDLASESADFSGKLITSTGAPIANAQVVLDQYIAESDADGNFIIEDIEPGTYPLSFFKEDLQLYSTNYQDSLHISGLSTFPQNIVLTASITPVVPPQTGLQTAVVTPAANAYVAGTIQAEATASGATISKVEFLVNGAVKSTQTTTVAANTYRASIDTKPLIFGDNVLQSKAYGVDGSTKLSESVHINVDNELPTAYLTAPTAGTTVTNSFTVKAQLNDRYLKDASVYLDTTKIPLTKVQPIFGAPYYTGIVNVSQVTEGLHPLKVVATDMAGNKNTEIWGVNKINVNVSRVVKTVTITAPDSYAIVPANSSVNFAATTSTGWTPSKVEFYTPIRICVDTTAPYACTWATGGREYSWRNISVVAYDSAGNAFRANRWVLVW